MQKLKDFYTSDTAPRMWEWCFVCVMLLIAFLSMFYGDTQSIVRYEAWFTGSIAEGGGLHNYYEYVYYLSQTAGGNYATYDFTMYIILGIWGIPLWFMLCTKGLAPDATFIARIYGKSILLVALAISCYLVYRVLLELGTRREHAKWGSYLYLSSALVYIAVGLEGQTDVIGVVFILLGVLFFIKRKRWQFVLTFMLAFTFKQYALFVFVPLLLIWEKNLIVIAYQTILVMSLHVSNDIIFANNVNGIQMKKDFEEGMFQRLTSNVIPLANGTVPIVIVLILGVCVWCYLHKELETKEEYERMAVYVPLLAFSLLFISFESSSYWYLHLAPYLAIALIYNSDNIRLGILFETAGIATLTMAIYATRPWGFDNYQCTGMLMEKLFGDYNSIENVLMFETFAGMTGMIKYAGVLFAAFIVCLGTFVYMCRPVVQKYDEKSIIRPYAQMRAICNAVLGLLPIGVFVYNLVCRR